MGKTGFLILTTLLAAYTPTPAVAQAWTGDINLLISGKHLDKNDWQPAERQGEVGIMSTFGRTDWPVAIALDLLAASKDAVVVLPNGLNQQRSRTSEVHFGARKIWKPRPTLRPYFGGGLSLATGEVELTSAAGKVADNDNGTGLWLGGGVGATLGNAFNIGVDLRFSGAEVKIQGAKKNAGGVHLGFFLGYHWGGSSAASSAPAAP